MGVICKDKVYVCVWGGGGGGGRGDYWDIKIFNATNCARRRHEATASDFFGKNKGHCGSWFLFPLILCILYMLRI